MLLTRETLLKDSHLEDILLKYQNKDKLEREVLPNMQTEMIADIISDKLMKKIQKSFENCDANIR